MIQPVRTYSPFAPPGLAGLMMTDTDQYIYRPHTFIFFYNDIPANGTVTGQYQSFDADADFFWRGILASGQEDGTQNSLFALRFQDPTGIYISDDFISDFGQSSFYQPQPYPLIPAIHCPAGSRILIDLQDQSGLGNSVQIAFLGVKRFAVSG